ncbi:endolytic transglycosylase MltG [Blastococcus sp. CT_GayMR16]|uniref:endolytic transglycosylase MltG n=1 Tax=Blastococcus sp. CT_GayMR16 TaxID=2559607 RepID=UPI001FD8596A|nr:endolytic transglycosylase MltG [Blastococcus sp. CT_GayMR16]
MPTSEIPGYGVPRYEPGRYDPPSWRADLPPVPVPDRSTGGFGRVSGLLDRQFDETDPVVEPEWWAYGSSDDPHYPLTARHGGDDRHGAPDRDSGYADDEGAAQQHPSLPLPPRPPGVWDRLRPREDASADDDATVAHGTLGGTPLDRDPRGGQTSRPVGGHRSDEDDDDVDDFDDSTDAHPIDDDLRAWDDQTGGLEVIGAHVEEDAPRPRGRRARREEALRAEAASAERARARRSDDTGRHHDTGHDALVHDEAFGEDIPVKPYDPRTGRARRKRSPVAVLISLLVLGGLVFGIVVGGQRLLELINPASQDYAGQGTGEVQVRVQDGDTLSDIARTLVTADVVASIGPFVDAAEANAAAVGIQPGVYGMRLQMSGQAALDLLLDPSARLLSRVTLPEGLTVTQALTRIAEQTGTPIAELEAVAADPVALGLPAYANGVLEGFLFPATYDIEPDDAPADVLRQMVARAVQALDELQIPEDQRLTVLTKASLVQAEAGSVEDMGKVARVLENRLADGMPLQLDTTVNYANGKGGITTTAQDRQNPSPYNTYVHPGLPPGAINNPGEDALRAVLSPTAGDWRFFVVVDPDTGDTRFAVTGEEHQQNVLLFQQWLRDNPEG